MGSTFEFQSSGAPLLLADFSGEGGSYFKHEEYFSLRTVLAGAFWFWCVFLFVFVFENLGHT